MEKIDVANLQYTPDSWNLHRNHSWRAGKTSFRNMFYMKENNQTISLPRLFGHLGSE